MTEQLRILIVPHTHWDREWYQTFQQFRFRLVRTVDKLLDILDRDPAFNHFMLDGQTIVLDDYLEVQPEQEERLKQHIRSGRILVGPWYLQPDEFLVSGEALIRNLQIGLQQATSFGNPMRVGYVPDSFGHIAQLPQLLQGVGIDNAVFWRGVSSEVQKSEFYWKAPDGTCILVIHLADPIGYSNARQMPLNSEEFITRVELLAANLLPKATTNTLLFMNGSDHLEPQDGLPAVIASANALLSHIDPARSKLFSQLRQNSQNGSKDYDAIQVQIGTLPQYIECIRQEIAQHEKGREEEAQETLQTITGDLRSSQYAHLLPSVLSTRIWIKQQNTATEQLLEHWVEPLTAWAWKSGAPYPHGLVRMAWHYLLQNHPHDSICGCSIDQVHHENAIRFAQSQQISESLIQQAMQQLVAETATYAPFPTPYANYEPVPIVVFNLAPGPRSEEIQTTVQLPGSLHNAVITDAQGTQVPYRIVNRWRQEIGSMAFAREMFAASITLAGISSPDQFLQVAHSTIMSTLGYAEDNYIISHVHIENYTQSPFHYVPHSPQPGVAYVEIMIAPKGRVTVNEQELLAAGQHLLDILQQEDIHTLELTLVDQAHETIDFLATDLPAYGYKTFWLYPRGLKDISPVTQKPQKIQQEQPTLQGQQHSIENEFYHVEVNAQDGMLIVTDKHTGVVFSGLNRFVDEGDVGDLYTYCPPEHDTRVSTPLEPPKVELLQNGPVRATLRVSGRWALPGACTVNRTERSSRMTICPIISEITLIPGVRRITIHTSIENRAKDHRLRVLFPVPYKVDTVATESTFEVRKRPIVHPPVTDTAEWIEEPVNAFPQKRFVDISDGQTGLAILNRGLPECEIVQHANKGADDEKEHMAVALTLLRCVEWLSRGDLSTRRGHAGPMEHTPEAQCLGHQEFDYAVVPHSGTWETEEAFVLREAQAFNIPVTTRAVVAEQHAGKLPAQATLVEVEPRTLVVSALKCSSKGQGLVARVYNPLAHTVRARIRPGVAFTQVHMTNLLEEYQQTEQTKGTKPTANMTLADAQAVEVDIRGSEIMTLVFE